MKKKILRPSFFTKEREDSFMFFLRKWEKQGQKISEERILASWQKELPYPCRTVEEEELVERFQNGERSCAKTLLDRYENGDDRDEDKAAYWHYVLRK